ncbi:DUF2381 family protein [Hyalangium versicolor]|uniref:DUF2381 family protein n=1 Tax=Hyalangium versicolor TaxID=2861190 RepID=UPI001CC9F3AC|nr:DUF2381 family protein [Hyalangium versicolor]
MKWSLLALGLVASAALAQPQSPTRRRQDRRAVLPPHPAEPMLELYVAAGNLTTAFFNASLDPSSLVVDKSRFKWAEVSDHFLMLEPFADVGEKLIVQVGFKDRALPAKAVIAVVSKGDVMDGKVEVDRRADTPEALRAALTQKEAELEELKARYAGNGPGGLMISEWLSEESGPVKLVVESPAAESHGLKAHLPLGYRGQFSALIAIHLRNGPGQKLWVLEQAHVTGPDGVAVKVLSVQMQPEQLAPGDEGFVVVEVKTPPWLAGKAFSVTLVDGSGERRISINLITK